jgi:cytochrome P450
MRDEQPLYYNDKHDFWAVTRWDDVEAALKDHGPLISSHGTILELIKANITDAARHGDLRRPPEPHRVPGVMSRVFTPRKMNAIEPEVRRYCQIELDTLVGATDSTSSRCCGEDMPMRVIGCCWASPSRPAGHSRQFRPGLHLDSATTRHSGSTSSASRPREGASASTSTGGWRIPPTT